MSTTALTAVLARLAGLNVAGKAAVGVGVALGAVGAAGGGSAVVEDLTAVSADVAEDEDATVTGGQGAAADPGTSEVPDETETAEPTGGTGAGTGTDESGSPGSGTDGGTDTAPARELPVAAEFGQSVAADARDGGVDGQEVSAAARTRAELRAQVRAEEREATGAEEPPTPTAPDVEAPEADVPAVELSGRAGAEERSRP